MQDLLISVGYYTSPLGGAPHPALVSEGYLLFEMITAGATYTHDGAQLCGPGWIFAHRGGQQTIWRSEADSHYECLVAQLHHAGASAQHDWSRCFRWAPSTAAVSFAQEILTAYHQHGIARDLLGQLIISQFALRLHLHQQQHTTHHYPAAIARVVNHIHKHHTEELSMPQLATLADMSVSHLHSAFKQHLGTSPHQYLISRRMRRARHQLATTLTSIAHIAHSIGYGNTESFCRAFKKIHDVTATAYRIQHSRSE